MLERLLKHIEGKLEDELDIDQVKRDQMLMYALLGDPAMRLSLPLPLNVERKQTDAGTSWCVTKPKDAQRLYVEFRKDIGFMSPSTARSTSEQFEQEFIDANHGLRFQLLEELDASENWQGLINQPGTIRLVAESKSKLYTCSWKQKANNRKAALD